VLDSSLTPARGPASSVLRQLGNFASLEAGTTLNERPPRVTVVGLEVTRARVGSGKRASINWASINWASIIWASIIWASIIWAPVKRTSPRSRSRSVGKSSFGSGPDLRQWAQLEMRE
jgi:hypothetical protein